MLSAALTMYLYALWLKINNDVVYSMTDMCIILADHTKVVHRLGSKFPVASVWWGKNPSYGRVHFSGDVLVPNSYAAFEEQFNALQEWQWFHFSVEVLPIAVTPVLRRLIALGGVPEVRSTSGKDGPVITDLGNMIVDVSFPNGVQNPAELEKNINLIPGVVDNGIVTGVATTVLVAVRNGNDVNVVNLEEFVQDMVARRYTNSVL
ncbi:hypothetical protein TIFTF001_026836 [Ficus carica]|uniref:Uncharacterized protein n=1 Tax=Ficus carica TaxID=3494 RepID=A0AA88DLZ6_FICCA|nr:hypothetical protein TIFTF001_026836 [Ficus carica]